MNTDYEVCRACGRYFRSEDGKPISGMIVEKKEDRGHYLCEECTREKEKNWDANS